MGCRSERGCCAARARHPSGLLSTDTNTNTNTSADEQKLMSPVPRCAEHGFLGVRFLGRCVCFCLPKNFGWFDMSPHFDGSFWPTKASFQKRWERCGSLRLVPRKKAVVSWPAELGESGGLQITKSSSLTFVTPSVTPFCNTSAEFTIISPLFISTTFLCINTTFHLYSKLELRQQMHG